MSLIKIIIVPIALHTTYLCNIKSKLNKLYILIYLSYLLLCTRKKPSQTVKKIVHVENVFVWDTEKSKRYCAQYASAYNMT